MLVTFYETISISPLKMNRNHLASHQASWLNSYVKIRKWISLSA